MQHVIDAMAPHHDHAVVGLGLDPPAQLRQRGDIEGAFRLSRAVPIDDAGHDGQQHAANESHDDWPTKLFRDALPFTSHAGRAPRPWPGRRIRPGRT